MKETFSSDHNFLHTEERKSCCSVDEDFTSLSFSQVRTEPPGHQEMSRACCYPSDEAIVPVASLLIHHKVNFHLPLWVSDFLTLNLRHCLPDRNQYQVLHLFPSQLLLLDVFSGLCLLQENFSTSYASWPSSTTSILLTRWYLRQILPEVCPAPKDHYS